MGRRVERTKATLIKEVKDYRCGSVGIYQHDYEHLLDHHPEMLPHFASIIESIQNPDKVCYDLSEFAAPESQNFYKQSETISNPNLCIKTTVAYDDKTWTTGHFVTAHKVDVRVKERETDANTIYDADKKK